MNLLFPLAALVAACLTACGGSDDAEPSVASVRLIGEQTISNSLQVDATLVGGLSGIDYDRASNTWYLISDDRSDNNPARYYTARLDYSQTGFTAVQVQTAVSLKQANGSTFPNRTTGGLVVDPESLRVDPLNNSLWWTSEGDRSLGLDPFVAQMGRDGKLLATLPLPSLFKMNPTQDKGSRNNGTFEGLSFAPDGQSLWAAMEAPVYEDGPLPTPTTPAVTRFTRYDRSGNVLGQYVYALDAIPAAPATGKNADNGVPEILAINGHQLLVLERAGVQGADNNYKNYVRLYEVDTDGASNINGVATLVGASYTPLKKRLVQDMNSLGLAKVDNLEGMAWGPLLANGRRSLVLVSDNNFNAASQITQFLAFEVLPK